jgi:hypothetical protein
MILKSTLAAGLIALSALAAAPANAGGVSIHIGVTGGHYAYHDGYGYDWKRHHRRDRHEYGTLTPREVRQVLRDKGYRQIRYVDRRGRIYEVRATNHRGHRVGLVVSARSGAILNVYRL